MTVQPGSAGAVERSQESSLADVVTTILDKGVVVDVFARVSLVGIELLRVDARVVVASVDTYLRFAEAANRLELGQDEPRDLPDVVEDVAESGSKGKSRGAIEAGAEKLDDWLRSDGQQERSADRGRRSQ
ncbi:MAG: gas vesicle protein [Streptosporangiales bacterium]|nr:gas vesicle protein [Streptosporangiales bacterium]